MLPQLEDELIYPKPENITLSVECNVVSVINPTLPLDFKLPDNVCSTLLATYQSFQKSTRVDRRDGKTLCESPIYMTRNYDINFAKYLSDALATYLPAQLTLNEFSRFDWKANNPEEYDIWNLIGISPYFRFMEHTPGSDEYPHYDNSHRLEIDPLTRTFMTGIIYLTDNDDGATAFIDDEQHAVKHSDRNLSSWERQAQLSQIYEWSLPKRGDIIVFPHGECHSIMRTTQPRKSIRFDVYYSAHSKK